MRPCDECTQPITGKASRFCTPECSRRWHRREWKRRNPDRQKQYKKASERNSPPRFIGVDVESIDGRLVMISAADHKGEAWTYRVHKGEEISTHQGFQFLLGLPRHAIKAGFWFDYDVNMLLRDLGRDHLQRLADGNRVYWGDYSIKHIPGKQFYMKDRVSGRSCTVWDFASFVRTSFAKLLRSWEIATEAEIRAIEEMKEIRAEFDWRMIRRIASYNEAECRYLALAARKIWQAARDAGIPLTSYYGGGSVAAVLLKRYHIQEASVEWHDLRSETAFYGGRFETSRVGLVRQPVWCYDINSAYPAATRDLPCLAHARWVRRRRPVEGPGLHLVRWSGDGPWGPFPVRREVGSLVYPSDGAGWYWWPEVEAALEYWPVELVASVSLVSACDHRPFQWVEEEARRRMELKAAGDFGAQVLKLGLNSVYGKLAQRVGSAPFHNTVWAGMVTSAVRAKLLRAIGPDPDAVLSMATDSVFAVRPLGLELGAGLGQWEDRQVDWMFFAQGGIYFWPETEGVVKKSRGFTGRSLTYERVSRAWEEGGIDGVVEIPQTRFIGYRTGLRREGLWRTWTDEVRHLRFDPRPRRVPAGVEGDSVRTRPPTSLEVADATLADLVLLTEMPDNMEDLEQPEPPEVEAIL